MEEKEEEVSVFVEDGFEMSKEVLEEIEEEDKKFSEGFAKKRRRKRKDD